MLLTSEALADIYRRVCSHRITAGDDWTADQLQSLAGAETIVPPGVRVWVGLFLPAEQADQLALPNGEPASDLHLTLNMVGDPQDGMDAVDVAKLIVAADMAAHQVDGPLVGRVAGMGQFFGADGGPDVLVATVDILELERLRHLVHDNLGIWNLHCDENHGYTPHITLAYVQPNSSIDAQVLPLDLTLPTLSVIVGDQRVDLTLGPEADMGAEAYHEEPGTNLADLFGRPGKSLRMFSELVSAVEPPPELNVMPKPGKYLSPKYGEIVITRERNRRMMENFNQGIYQTRVPIDGEHLTKESGALGWMTHLRQAENGSVYAQVEWTDRGSKMLKDNRFAFVSPEWYLEWPDPATDVVYKDVLIGAALTTRPFFKEAALDSLVASEFGLQEPQQEGDEPIVYFRPLVRTAEEVVMPEEIKPGTTATSESVAAAESVQTAETLRQMSERMAAMEDTIKLQSETIVKQSETITARETASRSLKFREIVLGQAEEDNLKGPRLAGEIADHQAIMETLYQASDQGFDGPAFQAYLKLQRATAAQGGLSQLLSESGSSAGGVSGNGDTGSQLADRANKLAAAENISLPDAMKRVASEHAAELREAKREAEVRV